MIALMGASGSGKSTLLNVLGCLDRLSKGSYLIAGEDTGVSTPINSRSLRRARFGFVFQRYNLLAQFRPWPMSRSRRSTPASLRRSAVAAHWRCWSGSACRSRDASPKRAFGRPAAACLDRPRLDERRRDHLGG